MKRIITIFLAIVLSTVSFAQNQYQVLVEKPNEKTYKGIISREALTNDTSFRWYIENQRGYTPNALALSSLAKQKDSIELFTFMGTWCEDSQFIIPKLFSLVDAAGFSTEKVTLVGVDRKKRTLSHLSEAMNIKNVPTIIVMKNGKEVGRVVEFGKYGVFDKELGEIVSSIDTH